MPLQAVQGLPVQVSDAQAKPDPAKPESADFLNILAGLMMAQQPLPQMTPQSDNPELSQVVEEKVVANLKPEALASPVILSAEDVQVASQQIVDEGGQATLPTQGVIADTTPQATPQATPKATLNEVILEKTVWQDNKQLDELPDFRDVPQPLILNVANGSVNQSLNSNEEEVLPSQGDIASAQARVAVSLISSQQGERSIVPQDKSKGERIEPLKLVNFAVEEQKPIQAIGNKADSNKTDLAKDLAGEMETEMPLAESQSDAPEIRPFTDYLPKEFSQTRETSSLPTTEFKVPSQELVAELPRIIESQARNSEGQVISKDIIIHLEPKDLGKLIVKLTEQEGVITVKILTEHPETRNLVETSFASLRQSFSEQGIKYGRLDVELGGQYLQQHMQQQQQQQQSQSQMNWLQRFPDNLWQDEWSCLENNSGAVAKNQFQPSGAVDYMV